MKSITTAFIDFLDCKNLVQIVDEPTHSGGNVLDLFIADVLDRYNITILEKICISDHFPFFIEIYFTPCTEFTEGNCS